MRLEQIRSIRMLERALEKPIMGLEQALSNLEDVRRSAVDLTRPIRMLERALLHLPNKHAIELAKHACTAIANCAHDADCVDDHELAEYLRDTNRMLYPTVAKCARSNGISPLLIPRGGIVATI